MNNLRKLREAANMSQTELAASVGISQRFVAFIEKGDKKPSLKTAINLADVLGCKVEDIFLPRICTNSTYKKKEKPRH